MGENMLKEKMALLDRYIISQQSHLEQGVVLLVGIEGGFLKIFNEKDLGGNNRTVSIIEEFNAKLDISINDLIT